jgi:hypothetical protein
MSQRGSSVNVVWTPFPRGILSVQPVLPCPPSHHFGSKEGLYQAVLQRVSEEMDERFFCCINGGS